MRFGDSQRDYIQAIQVILGYRVAILGVGEKLLQNIIHFAQLLLVFGASAMPFPEHVTELPPVCVASPQ